MAGRDVTDDNGGRKVIWLRLIARMNCTNLVFESVPGGKKSDRVSQNLELKAWRTLG